MNATLSRLLSRLEGGSLLAVPLLEPHEIGAALDARNDEQFESEWLRLHERLTAADKADDATEAALTRIRELAFKAAYRGTDDPDFAGYVSDDFELVARAIIVGEYDPWLNGLFAAYRDGRFPAAQVQPVQTSLEDLV
jgi:hypothetical protein